MTNEDTVLVTSSAHYDLLQLKLKGLEQEIRRLRELLSHRSFAEFGQKESDVVEALRERAKRVRSSTGFNPGEKYEALADEIQATIRKAKS